MIYLNSNNYLVFLGIRCYACYDTTRTGTVVNKVTTNFHLLCYRWKIRSKPVL